jgi:hypothetical protein
VPGLARGDRQLHGAHVADLEHPREYNRASWARRDRGTRLAAFGRTAPDVDALDATSDQRAAGQPPVGERPVVRW